VCNGSVLSDDGASLASAGVKPGATIYVVKKLSSLSEATAEVNLRKEKAAASKSRSSECTLIDCFRASLKLGLISMKVKCTPPHTSQPESQAAWSTTIQF